MRPQPDPGYHGRLGEVPEWSNGPDSKSGVRLVRTVGSNPTLSAKSKSPAKRGFFIWRWGWRAEPTRVRQFRRTAELDEPQARPAGVRATDGPHQSHPLSRSVLGPHQTVAPSNDPPNAPAEQRTDEPQARTAGVRAKDGPHQSHPLSRSVLGRDQPVRPPYDPPHAPPGACPWSALPHWSPPQNSGRTSRRLAPKSRSGLWHPQVPAPPRRTHPGSSTPSLDLHKKPRRSGVFRIGARRPRSRSGR